MSGEWPTKSVAELQAAGVLLVEDGNHGENRPRRNEFAGEGIQFIRAADMDGGRVLFESAQRINEVARKRIRKGIGAGGDVLLSHKGTVGKVAYVPIDAPPFVCSPQTTFWRVTDATQLDRRYIYFYLQSRPFREQLDSRKGETDMADYVSLTSQRTLKVTVPPIANQNVIATVLGALDDKIELSRRMNATMDAMARALFQSWFVDFDPVRANLDGCRPTSLDAATAALFPDSLQESAVGPIPYGWDVGRLDEVLTLQRGFDLPTPERTYGQYPVLAASGPNGCHNKFMVRGPGVTTGRSGVLGKVFYVHGDFWPLNTSLWVKEFKRASPEYAFHLLRSIDFELFNAGSAVPTLNRNHVHNLPVVIPPKNVIDAFSEKVSPMMKKQKANEDHSLTVAEIRDALLPKLLCGDICV
jgi:type I restriction enzyme S subunit